MRATANFCESILRLCFVRRLVGVALAACLSLAVTLQASDKDAEDAARRMAASLEPQGYQFRAESWVRDLKPEIGKALRVQLFKKNDYRFCVAVPANSGVRITATVLDEEGKPVGNIMPLEEGWGCVLMFEPKKTGLYVIAVRQAAGGKSKTVPCAVVTGYK